MSYEYVCGSKNEREIERKRVRESEIERETVRERERERGREMKTT